MENCRLYEKIKILKNENLSNMDIAKKLSNEDDTTLVEAMETIHDYDYIQVLGKKMQDLLKDVEMEYKHNEYGIPMIDKDEDW